MKLLLALDSRWANKAAVGLLDPHTASWSSFETVDLPEGFNRRGFRGMSVVDNRTIYVVNSGALYRLRLNTSDDTKPLVTVEQTIRRPEWEVGQRSAADLHHVHYVPQRDVLLVANSAMDSVDEVSPDGQLLARRYLWDMSAEIAQLAQERTYGPSIHDLAHVNHVTTHGDYTYLTLGNLNGTRVGCIVRLETGEIVLDGLRFPHDGVVLEDDLFITNSDTSELLVWHGVGDMNLRGRAPDAVLPIRVRQDAWRESFQWVRGVAGSREHIVVGVTQWKNTDEEHPQVPPRLVFFTRRDLAFEGEIFLPKAEGFPSPCVYSIHVLDDDREESIPADVWERATLAPPTSEVVDDSQIPSDQPGDLTLLLNTARERSQRLMEQAGAYRAEAQAALKRAGEQNSVLRERLDRSKQQNTALRDSRDRLKARQAATHARLDTATARLEAIWQSRWWRLGLVVRRLLRRPTTFARFPVDAARAVFGRRPSASSSEVSGATAAVAPSAPHPQESAVDQPPEEISRLQRSYLQETLDAWIRTAREAPGSEAVFMFSGTTFVQEMRANRPIRLTRVFLEQGSPVFFNYYRWEPERLPANEHPLLFQSPIDLTPSLLEQLFEADLGEKRRLLFVSFPHELMVRNMLWARQQGWLTIYDVRDDWEEFAKVGAARWFDPAFERYVVSHADIVTAVSGPLSQKMQLVHGRADVPVVPNALDIAFPASPQRVPSQPPIVGYFGHLTPQWFDWDLLIQAAISYPDWTFELAGHQAPDGLDLPPNVRLLGLLGHLELAKLSARWSLAIIPFKTSPLAESADPIKVYEYLHLGLPVLASYIPQIRHYPGCTVTESTREFLDSLPACIERASDERSVRDWLARNRWEDRIEAYRELASAATRDVMWSVLG